MEILIIPDLHCRDFWKSAVESWNENIIFLGDYLDPYPHEWDDKSKIPDSPSYLLDILNFKDRNQARVTLLVGNHDFHYLHKDYDSSRKDFKNWITLNQIYTEDKEFFQIAKQIDNTLFTHAGVSTAWLNRHDLTLPINDADVFLNEIYNTTPNIFWEMSWERGGWCSTGSPIWHDVRELDIEENHFNVFSHTQLIDKPVSLNNFICCDCRKPFIFNTITHEIKDF